MSPALALFLPQVGEGLSCFSGSNRSWLLFSSVSRLQDQDSCCLLSLPGDQWRSSPDDLLRNRTLWAVWSWGWMRWGHRMSLEEESWVGCMICGLLSGEVVLVAIAKAGGSFGVFGGEAVEYLWSVWWWCVLVFFLFGEAVGLGEGEGHFGWGAIGGSFTYLLPIGHCDRHFF